MTDIIASAPEIAVGYQDTDIAKTKAISGDEFDLEITDTVGKPFVKKPKMSSRHCDVFYADKQAIFNLNG